MPHELGVGLIGYGGIGRMHALCYAMLPLVYPDLPARAKIVGVATAGSESAERARRELGDVFVTTSAEQLIEHPGVALVDCCAPTGDHARYAAATLRAGKLLYCEKPLTGDARASAELAELARARGLAAGVNYHFRQIPALQLARELTAQGLLGEVYGFHMRYFRASNLKRDRPVSWRFAGPGSGVLVDLGAHLVDLVLTLLGPIVSVSAQARTVVPERPGLDGRPVAVTSDDAAWLQLGLAGGGRGTLAVSKIVPGAGDDLRIEAYGSAGWLCFDTADPNSLVVAEGAGAPQGGRRIVTASRSAPATTLIGGETPVGVVQWHLAALAGFLGAASAGAPADPGLEAGLAVDRVLSAACESLAQAGVAVSVGS